MATREPFASLGPLALRGVALTAGAGEARELVARRRVLWSIVLTLGAAFIELVGAAHGRSLFLKADAVHLAAHMAIYVALLFPERTRARRDWPTIAVLAVVWCVALGIIASAVGELVSGAPAVAAETLLLSLVGLAANLATASLLAPGRQRLAFRVAVVHELSDGCLTVIALVGAVAIWCWGWRFVDPGLSIVVGVWLMGWATTRLPSLWCAAGGARAAGPVHAQR